MDYCTCGENKGRCIDCAEDQLATVTKERDEAREANARIVRGEFAQICSYCGWEAPANGATWEELQEHIKTCPKHPLTTAREENERLTAENANLRAATRGKTFFHSDEEVNAEMGRLRAEHESLVKELHLTRLALEEAAKSGFERGVLAAIGAAEDIPTTVSVHATAHDASIATGCKEAIVMAIGATCKYELSP